MYISFLNIGYLEPSDVFLIQSLNAVITVPPQPYGRAFLFQKFRQHLSFWSTNVIILSKSLELWRSNDIQIANLIVISSNLVLALWQIIDVHVMEKQSMLLLSVLDL